VCRSLAYSDAVSASQGVMSSTDSHPNSLFVKGLPKDKWSHNELYNAFEPFGKIRRAKVSIDKDHKSRGYGFVEFELQEDSVKAVNEVKSPLDLSP
jgi:RNA recognition motif-containing protein